MIMKITVKLPYVEAYDLYVTSVRLSRFIVADPEVRFLFIYSKNYADAKELAQYVKQQAYSKDMVPVELRSFFTTYIDAKSFTDNTDPTDMELASIIDDYIEGFPKKVRYIFFGGDDLPETIPKFLAYNNIPKDSAVVIIDSHEYSSINIIRIFQRLYFWIADIFASDTYMHTTMKHIDVAINDEIVRMEDEYDKEMRMKHKR